MTIDFYDPKDFRIPVLSFSVAPHKPGLMCTSSQSTLMYVDRRTNDQEIRILDCGTYPPKGTNERTVLLVEKARRACVRNMCIISHAGREMLITSSHLGVKAYNTDSGELVWRTQGKHPGLDWPINARGLAVDDEGRILVCDRMNNCIQIFSPDGADLGVVLKDHGTREPLGICYRQSTYSYVLIHDEGTRCKISIFSRQ